MNRTQRRPRFGFTLVELLVVIGTVETLAEPGLEDTRHWANLADRPDWTLRPAGSP